MTLAEIVLLAAGGTVLYVLLRPLQRWLEASLLRKLSRRPRRSRRDLIDVTNLTSHSSHKEDHEHDA